MKDKISVAMATYNGDKYIKKQINSILENLNDNDELIISDDGSTDETIKIVNEISKIDNRVKIFEGPHNGVKKNFANAIEKCTGDYIFLSDQDDIWKENKVKIVMSYFKKENCMLIQHDAVVVDKDEKEMIPSFFEFRKCKTGIIRNIYKNRYIGCCMAFDKKLKKYILPIPNNIEMHDQWIGILAEEYGKSVFIKDKLINYRRHEDNASDCFKHYPMKRMVNNRLNLIKELIKEKMK